MISDTLKALLIATKSANYEKPSWEFVAKILGPIYSYDMKMLDVLHILVEAYQEALDEPRFEVTYRHDPALALRSLLEAPIKGFFAVDWPAPRDGIKSAYTIEQFYNAQIAYILGELRMTKARWLVEEGQMPELHPPEIKLPVKHDRGDDSHV